MDRSHRSKISLIRESDFIEQIIDSCSKFYIMKFKERISSFAVIRDDLSDVSCDDSSDAVNPISEIGRGKNFPTDVL